MRLCKITHNNGEKQDTSVKKTERKASSEKEEMI